MTQAQYNVVERDEDGRPVLIKDTVRPVQVKGKTHTGRLGMPLETVGEPVEVRVKWRKAKATKS